MNTPMLGCGALVGHSHTKTGKKWRITAKIETA